METGNIIYEELKSDEKILIQWYRENPGRPKNPPS